MIGVLVSAQNVDRVATHAHTRPWNQTLINGVTNCRIGGARAFRAHIAFSGVSGHQVIFCGLLGKNDSCGDRLFHRLQILCARMEKQVNMHIDQPGQKRCIAQVDHLRRRRMFDGLAHRTNALAFNQHFTRLQYCACVDLQQACRVQHVRSLCGSLAKHRSGSKSDEEAPNEGNARRSGRVLFDSRHG